MSVSVSEWIALNGQSLTGTVRPANSSSLSLGSSSSAASIADTRTVARTLAGVDLKT